MRDHGRGVVAEQHVEDHGMHHLMLEHVVEVRIAALEGEHDAVLEDFREAADAFVEREADDVGLLEFGVGIVQDDGDAGAQLVPDGGIHALVHGFHVAGREPGDEFGALGEVDVEMLGPVVRPMELVVLHLVLPE